MLKKGKLVFDIRIESVILNIVKFWIEGIDMFDFVLREILNIICYEKIEIMDIINYFKII